MKLLSPAALATGIFTLTALAASNAEASIVTNTFATPIVINNTTTSFDVNDDGRSDIRFTHSSTNVNTYDGEVNATAAVYGRIAGLGPFALPVTAIGEPPINPNTHFASRKWLAENTSGTSPNSRSGNLGIWANDSTLPIFWPPSDQSYRYLAFTFLDLNNLEHYGWADVGVKSYDNADPTGSFEITVYGTAYDTAPTTVAEPASLALLTMGAAGLLARRRRAVTPAV